MRFYGVLLAGVFTCISAFSATDPFVGTWAYNAQKSPQPTIRYTIKHLGGERYALTGSTGITVEVKADGVVNKLPSGTTVSFKKLDERNWEMDRDDGEKMVRTINISADDKTLTLHDVFTGNPGDNYETIARYARLSPGTGISGEWQSFSVEETTIGEPLILTIGPFQSDGLSFSLPAKKHLSEMRFDGKAYASRGTGDTQGESSMGKRVDDRTLKIDIEANGKPEESEELKVSADGRTLTIVRKLADSAAQFTMVWDRQ